MLEHEISSGGTWGVLRGDRLLVATRGVWTGYCVLSMDALWTPEDAEAPFTLFFDTATWTPIDPVPVSRFRGVRLLKRGVTEGSEGYFVG